jgi:hypothetical protein
MATDPELLVEKIIEIASDTTRSPAEEAYVIARAYHDLCVALAEARQLGYEHLNWAGFAQWSSKAIGASLTLDDSSPFWTRMLKTFRIPRLLGGPVRAITRLLLGGSYGRGLSLANRTIFLEIATLYTNLLEGNTRATWRSSSFEDTRLVGRADEELLFRGAALVDQAIADPQQRAESVLGANIAISAYEQARAQPALEYVAYRPVRWILRVSWRLPWHFVSRRPLRRYDIYTGSHKEQHWLVRRLEASWARFYTRVLVVDTPIGPVRMAKPLVPPPTFRTELASPTDPTVRSLVERFRPASAPDSHSGVVDWLDYDERMRFIVGYFMMYQNVPQMFDPPFGADPANSPIWRALHGVPTALRQIVPVPWIIDPSLDDVKDVAARPGAKAPAEGDDGTDVHADGPAMRAPAIGGQSG